MINFITALIAGILGSLTTLFINFINNKQARKNELKNLMKEKPELYIIKKEKTIPDIKLFIGSFSVKYSDNNEFEFIYKKSLKNVKNHDYIDYTFKNIGKSDINCLDIAVTMQKNLFLIEYGSLNSIVDNKYLNYNYCYDEKILKDDRINVRIYFEKNKQVCLPFSATIVLLFQDSNNLLWEQPFFYEQNKLYPPFSINYSRYRATITTDNAMECFEKPYLW